MGRPLRDYNADGEGARLARDVAEFVNHHGLRSPEAQDFVEALRREHRTLQQQVFGLFMKVVVSWGRSWRNARVDLKPDEFGLDLRNEFACKVSDEIVGKVEHATWEPPLI